MTETSAESILILPFPLPTAVPLRLTLPPACTSLITSCFRRTVYILRSFSNVTVLGSTGDEHMRGGLSLSSSTGCAAVLTRLPRRADRSAFCFHTVLCVKGSGAVKSLCYPETGSDKVSSDLRFSKAILGVRTSPVSLSELAGEIA